MVADADFDLTMIDIPDRTIARKVIHAACDAMAHGWLGRQLPYLLRQAGLSDIRVQGRIMQLDYAFFQQAFRGLLNRAQTMGSLSDEELARFWAYAQQAEQEQRFCAGTGGFIISGRKS